MTLREDYPTAIAGVQYGANLNTIGFNMDFIVAHDPALADKLMKLYQEAANVKRSDPPASDKEQALALQQMSELMEENAKGNA